MAEPLVLLHGFAGTHHSWDEVLEHLPAERYRPVVAPDLLGHGSRSAESPADWAELVGDAGSGLPEARSVLVGYSLGARLALHVALAVPEQVARLVLISVTAGIESGEAREARAAADDRLADEIATMTPEQFADSWQAQPIFAGTAGPALQAWRSDLLRNDPRALAATLRAVTPGRMPPVWDRIGELAVPVTIVVGERDAAYRTHAARIAGVTGASVITVPGAGHGLPREAPADVAAALG